MSVLTGKRDYAAVKKALEAAGYQGEKVVLMVATDQPLNYPLADVAADMLKRVGMNVDYQATDWGTVVQRRALTKPPSEGGWNLSAPVSPGSTSSARRAISRCAATARAPGSAGPTIRRSRSCARPGSTRRPCDAEEDRRGDPASGIRQRALYPLGLAQFPTAFRQDITGVPEGFAIFWNVRRV